MPANGQREELVQGILGVLERTYPEGQTRDTVDQLAEFFRGLDPSTLRAIAYRQGLFDPDIDLDPEDDHE